MNALRVDEDFVPCPVEGSDELFPNGIFVFNVSRILEHVGRNPADVALVEVVVASLARWDRHLDDAHVASADLARPLVLAEISPGNYNLIDGHHRVEKARRTGVETMVAYRLTAAQHVAFLTSTTAYRTYVAYWNGKLDEQERDSGWSGTRGLATGREER